MQDFTGKIAVITGGGMGMGRELARQLAAEGCSVALCDLSVEAMEETARLAMAEAPQGVRVVTYKADVAMAAQMQDWAQTVQRDLDTDHIHLLFNNAGIAGGGSFVKDSPAAWERTFGVTWGGVYHATRAFLPLLMRAQAARIVNTSSVNGFWASIGPGAPHTAYSAAKFAVKGFTEALMTDLAVNAPHVQCSLVMPGHIGTDIIANTAAFGESAGGAARAMLAGRGLDVAAFTDAQLTEMVSAQFRNSAPTTAEAAAKIILDGVKAGAWRILVGEDAQLLDRMVREAPEAAYGAEFFETYRAKSGWNLGG